MIKTGNTIQEEKLSGLPGTLGAVAKGVITAYIFLVIAFVILALVYTYTPMPDKYLNPAVNILGFVGIFIAGFTAAGKAGNRGWLHGAIAGILYAVVRFALGYAVFKHYVPSQGIFENLLVTSLVSVLGGIVGVNRKAVSGRS